MRDLRTLEREARPEPGRCSGKSGSVRARRGAAADSNYELQGLHVLMAPVAEGGSPRGGELGNRQPVGPTAFRDHGRNQNPECLGRRSPEICSLWGRVFGCLGFRRWRELLGLSHSKDSSGYGKEIQPTNRPIAIGHTTTAQCSEGLNIVVLDINCRTQKWAHQHCTGIIKVQNAGEFSLLLYSRLGLTLDCYFGTLGQAYKAFGLATQPIEELYEMKIANPIPFALHR